MPPIRNSGAMSEFSASGPKSRPKPVETPKSTPRGNRARDGKHPMPEPGNKVNDSNAFLSLPLELKLQIVELLPTRDIPNVRMMSESWATAGAPSMFRDGFTIRPHVDDMDRLGLVCLRPQIAKGIRFIKIFAGDTDKDLLVKALYRAEQQLNWATGGQLTKVWNQIDAIFDHERMQKHCHPGLLDTYLPSLPNLEVVKVTSLECPVQAGRGSNMPFSILWSSLEEDFDEDDEDLAHFLNTDLVMQKYSAIVSAAIKCKTITSLALDSFPIDYFNDRARASLGGHLCNALLPSPALKDKLANITTLQIDIIARSCPYPAGFPQQYNSDLGRRMAEFIGCFQNLHTLNVSYNEVVDETYDCVWGFGEAFYRLKFPRLHSFLIAGCDSTELTLGKFLFAHKRTLRNLHISETACTPVESSWKEILTKLRDHLSLEKFELYDPDSDGRIYDANWKRLPSDGKTIKDASLLELYVLGKCPWPMAESNPRNRGWKRKFGAEDMMLLDLTEEERRDLLGEDWETDGESEAEDEDEDMSDYSSGDFEMEEISSMQAHGSSGDENENENVVAFDGEWEDMEAFRAESG